MLAPAGVAAAAGAGVPEAAAPLALCLVAAAGAYVALFVLIGSATRRAAVWSLAVVLLGERLLGTVLSGIAQVSPQWLARDAYSVFGPDAEVLLRSGVPSGGDALARLAAVGAVSLLLAAWRIRHLRLVGAAD